MILYHGSQNETVEPSFGRGDDRHDFGRGFYLTDSAELAGEWSVCRPESHDGWIHAFDLDLTGLKVFDFREFDPLAWVAELMRHRDAEARNKMRELIADPSFNRLERLFTDLIREDRI